MKDNNFKRKLSRIVKHILGSFVVFTLLALVFEDDINLNSLIISSLKGLLTALCIFVGVGIKRFNKISDHDMKIFYFIFLFCSIFLLICLVIRWLLF